MKPINKCKFEILTMLTSACLATIGVVHASSSSDEQSLRRGAVEDVTPQQKYQSAIREAGGAQKEALRECALLAPDARLACAREAKATYAREMATAKLILK